MDENKNTTDNEKQSWADKAEDTLQDLKERLLFMLIRQKTNLKN